MITTEQIRKQLALAIQQSNLSQEAIAKKINVKQQTISEYANGKSFPSLDTFANLCEALDVDANDVLCLKRIYLKRI